MECGITNLPPTIFNNLIQDILTMFTSTLPMLNGTVVIEGNISTSRMSIAQYLVAVVVCVVTLPLLEHGFCDYDQLISPDDRGTYYWNEAMTGDPPQARDCFYEPQVAGGMARRACTAHRQWSHPSDPSLTYDGSECVTRSTAELRNLSRVRILLREKHYVL